MTQTTLRPSPKPIAVLALCLLLAACGTSREVAREPEPPPEPADTEELPVPRPPPPETPPPEPEPPPPEPPAPVTRTVQGFRIQIHMTAQKASADTYVEQAVAWWRTLSSPPPYLGNGDLEVDLDWRQPYYRVRLGSFATRAEAERALSAVARRFPDALIVPDTVTITRYPDDGQ